MSQSPSMPFTPQQALEFMQKMWNPLGLSVPGAPQAAGTAPTVPFPNPMAMFATLDPADVERKIGELRVIESWLTMSLNFMQMSIKTLEWQKASLEALRAGAAASTTPPPEPEPKPQAHGHGRKSKPKEEAE